MLSPKEADFFAKAKAEGFDDETIAAEIKSRRTAAPVTSDRPRRGDEPFQPDPSPSGPITVKSPKSVGDAITGGNEMRNVQDEIKRGGKLTQTSGMPAEPLREAEDRANKTRLANDPIANDWIAQEIVSGVPATKVVSGLGAGAKFLGNKVIDRVAGRELDTIARGAPSAARKAIGKTEAKELVKSEPSIAKASGNEGKIGALDDFIEKETAKGDVIYSKHDAASAVVERPKLAPLDSKGQARGEAERFADAKKSMPKEPVSEFEKLDTVNAGPSTEAATVGNAKVSGKIPDARGPARNRFQKATATKEPIGEPKNAFEPDGIGAVKEPVGKLQAAGTFDPPPEMIPGRGAGVSVESFTDNARATIARLAGGTNSQKETAKAMEGELKTFLQGKDPKGVISARELRRQASDFQAAYDKTATNSANAAKKELSKDALRTLDAHIKDPADLEAIQKINSRVHSAKTMRDALAKKLETEKAPGAPIKEGPGVIKSVLSAPAKGAKAVGRGAEQILAKLAHAHATGGDVATLTEQAVRLGVTQAVINQTMAEVDKHK